jgi:hypothetical protein
VTASIDDKADDKQFVVVDDYLALRFEQRYNVMSQRFPAWLKAEPIVFPADHPTYAWACLVNGCNAMLRDSYPGLLCMLHFREYKRAKESMAIEDFLRVAKPLGGHGLGWALKRKTACKICGSNREALCSGYCPSLGRAWTMASAEERLKECGVGPNGACLPIQPALSRIVCTMVTAVLNSVTRGNFRYVSATEHNGRNGSITSDASRVRIPGTYLSPLLRSAIPSRQWRLGGDSY